MTDLRSGSQADSMNQQNDDRDGVRPPKNPKHQHTKKPNANSAGGQRQQPNPNTDLLAARKRHIRYRKRVHINELKTGDNADTLREKRRLVQKEFEAGRLDGKATRELHDLYAKRNIGKIEHQRTLAHNLSDGAKEAKERLEEVFGKTAGAGGADGSGDGALGEPSNGEDLSDTSGDEAMEDTESDGNMETADVNPSKSDEHGTYRIAALPYRRADNDAVAKQRALALGLELANYSAPDQGPGAHRDDAEGEDEGEVKMEDEDE